MKQSRARRLGDLLEAHGWNVWEVNLECRKCGYSIHSSDASFCDRCGGKLRNKESKKEIEIFLEEMIATALGEKQ